MKAPIVTILAFVPMLLISFAYKELNKADPDCGTTFTWATRAFGPKAGWMGGWGIVAADILVMASLAQIAGQYIFLLFNTRRSGATRPAGGCCSWGSPGSCAMTAICYVGIEISANFQKVLLGIEIVMLVVLSVVALVKVGNGSAPRRAPAPSWSWFNPVRQVLQDFVDGLTLMLFIYWGWDTAVSVNEETKDKDDDPGRAAVISTVILLAVYLLVILVVAVLRRARARRASGSATPPTTATCCRCSAARSSAPRDSAASSPTCCCSWCCSSAAASTQTTILPTARTTLSMAVYKAIPSALRPGSTAGSSPRPSPRVTMGSSRSALRGHELRVAWHGDHRLGRRPSG